jgi:predicted O-methyltransferase YrrM
MLPTEKSLNIVRRLSKEVPTIHHHHHLLYDILDSYPEDQKITYVEIGCFAGASSCLALQRPNTKVIAIDLGLPIPKETVLYNVSCHNPHNNSFDYILGDSHSLKTVNKLLELVCSIDVLFIDGGHNETDVIQDYSLYNGLIVAGGYIVFDDYNDFQFSPEVKKAVDCLVPLINEYYEIIGTFNNTLEAYPLELKEGNCFVMRKLQ